MANQSQDLLQAVEHHFTRYAALQSGVPLVLALWSVATWMFDRFDCFPYLAITSPTKRCGKTRVAELLELVTRNPQRTVGITPAALFHCIQEHKPTLIIDEAELMRSRDERAGALREILNAGYRKGQKVIRCARNGGNYDKLQEFDTFAPKALVLIGDLPDTLADRSIPISMKRRTAEQLERFRFGRVQQETQELRDKMHSWAEENQSLIQNWYEQHDISALRDREAEIWLPLFAICALIAPERLPELEAIALRFSNERSAAEPADLSVKLLADIQTIFQAQTLTRLSTKELISKLTAIDDSFWSSFGLDSRKLSRLLRPFGIQPKNLRLLENEVCKGYEKGQLEEVWKCYLPAATSATAQYLQQLNHDSELATNTVCSSSETLIEPAKIAACSVVADSGAIQQQVQKSA
jgi:hypothetical protein